MPRSLLYLASNKNIPVLFSKIQAARKPDALTHSFLTGAIGLKGSGDRQLITMLKTLGFIDAGGRPTAEYDKLKNASVARAAIASAIRRAYEPVFAANENAHTLQGEDLRGLIAQVGGTDADMTSRISQTFTSLVKAADFDAAPPAEADLAPVEEHRDEAAESRPSTAGAIAKGLRSEFHYNIQVHLPSNGTEETYLNIFSALQKVFR
jgi:hypothetical protein